MVEVNRLDWQTNHKKPPQVHWVWLEKSKAARGIDSIAKILNFRVKRRKAKDRESERDREREKISGREVGKWKEETGGPLYPLKSTRQKERLVLRFSSFSACYPPPRFILPHPSFLLSFSPTEWKSSKGFPQIARIPRCNSFQIDFLHLMSFNSAPQTKRSNDGLLNFTTLLKYGKFNTTHFFIQCSSKPTWEYFPEFIKLYQVTYV